MNEPLHAIRCTFMRGGTSRALIFHTKDLPSRREDWALIFLEAMGSPDTNGRQLDGMGGGISSLSKVCVVGPPSRPDADVDYTFAQISVETPSVDYGGNCGNMSSAIGPFAVEEGLVDAPVNGQAQVRIHNTNTSKIIVASFPMHGTRPAVKGDLAIDGVAGTGAPIRLEFRDLAGARTGVLLPSGAASDELRTLSGRTVRTSLVDAANPCVFVLAQDLGLDGTETPESIEADTTLMQELEHLRRQASVRMKIAPDEALAAQSKAVPFIGVVAPPRAWRTRSGAQRNAGEADIAVRMLSSGNPHRTIPVTSALCVAVAARTLGTVVAACTKTSDGPLRIAHSSGTIMVEAQADTATGEVRHASVYRTARRLFQGEVLVPNTPSNPL